MSETAKTFGETRIRTSFNPSDDSIVQNIKERAAELINYINDNIEPHTPGDVARWKSLACTAIEEGAMWAVKAATA